MPGNKDKQRRWYVDKHPVFAILKADISVGIKVCLEIFRMDSLEIWCISLFYVMYISFRREKRGKKKCQDNGLIRN